VLDSTDGSIKIYGASGDLEISISPGGGVQVWNSGALVSELGMVTGIDGGLIAYGDLIGDTAHSYAKVEGGQFRLGFPQSGAGAAEAFVSLANAGSFSTPADPQYLHINSGYIGDTDNESASLRLYSGVAGSATDPPKVWVESGVNARGVADMEVRGRLTSGNERTGRVTITPSAANVPTSTTVTYASMAGTTFRGFATAETTVIGTGGVTGASVTSMAATSALVWVNRVNTTATVVDWMIKSV
jgi:hypothetical protein